jgi:hypothetical protein
LRASDASGKLTLTEVASGNNVKRSLLDSNDVFVYDAGSEVYAWVGLKASKVEKKTALAVAQDYLSQYKRPLWLPVVRILEGGENEVFEAHFR